MVGARAVRRDWGKVEAGHLTSSVEAGTALEAGARLALPAARTSRSASPVRMRTEWDGGLLGWGRPLVTEPGGAGGWCWLRRYRPSAALGWDRPLAWAQRLPRLGCTEAGSSRRALHCSGDSGAQAGTARGPPGCLGRAGPRADSRRPRDPWTPARVMVGAAGATRTGAAVRTLGDAGLPRFEKPALWPGTSLPSQGL